jgi:DNA cross-link repair 1A protein
VQEIERHVNECLDSDQLPLPDTPNQVVQPKKKEDNSKFSGVLSDISVPQVNTAFSVLMSSHKESIAWKEASEAENMKGSVKGRRLAPFYKVLLYLIF